tara:strand:- start:82 stop:729 length:648 start_codon:yes stop_codon:yes gene_type:complete
MNELLNIIFSGVNFIPTTLFVLVLFYWLIVLIGAVDTDFLDIDIDMDTDADIDVDTEGASGSDLFALNKVLAFFNLGKIPFMVFLTFLAIPLWFLTIMINHILDNNSILFSLILLIPILTVSLFITKILTIPFVKLFAILDKDNEEDDIIGAIGDVRLGANSDKKGQADVMVGESFFTIFIKTHESADIVKKGDKVLVLDHIKEGDYFLVEKYNY